MALSDTNILPNTIPLGAGLQFTAEPWSLQIEQGGSPCASGQGLYKYLSTELLSRWSLGTWE